MGELKTRPTTDSVAEFLAGQPDQRRADCEAVLRISTARSKQRSRSAYVEVKGAK